MPAQQTVTVVNRMLKKLDSDISGLRDGLDPENLAIWYDKIVHDTIEMAPPWLHDKVKVRQNPILGMKFELDISKRAVRYFMMAVDSNAEHMPYSTRLYFLKVQEIMAGEMDRSLV